MRERLIELLNKKYDHFCDQCGVNKDSHYTESYVSPRCFTYPMSAIGKTVFATREEAEQALKGGA